MRSDYAGGSIIVMLTMRSVFDDNLAFATVPGSFML